MWLEFAAPHPGARPPEPAGLVARVDPEALTAEIERSGGRVVHLEVAPGVDMFDNPDPAVARMRVIWPRPSSAGVPAPADQKGSV
jgi:hypothetical protein